MDSGHARYSPSTLKSRELCPGFEPKKDGEVHIVTQRGTAMHQACEIGDFDNLNAEETKLVMKCLDYVERIRAELMTNA
jgi:hypothetical protein